MYNKKLLPRRCPKPELEETTRESKNTRWTIVFALAACLISGNSYAKQAHNSKEDFVDCGLPNASLQDAIDNASGPTIITFIGSCIGDLLITRDGITIQGQVQSDEIVGEVSIEGALRTRLSNMTISGGANGITAIFGAVLGAENVIITGVSGWGVGSYRGAVVYLTGVDITGNGGDGVSVYSQAMAEIREGSSISSNGGDGIEASRGAVVALTGVNVNGNGGHGVSISNQAMVDIREGSSISGNGRDGVSLNNGSLVQIRGATIQDNAGHGVQAFGSRVRIRSRAGIDPVLSGNAEMVVKIAEGSSCRISDATISYTGSRWRALKVSRSSGCTIERSTLTSSNPNKGAVLISSGSGVSFADGNSVSSTAGAALGIRTGASVDINGGAIGNTFSGKDTAMYLRDGASLIQWDDSGSPATISGNVSLSKNNTARFQNATITGDVFVDLGSTLMLENATDSANTTVTGNIEVSNDSILAFRKSPSGKQVTVTGNVTCFDAESSLSGFGEVVVTDLLNCSGF